MKYLWIFLLSVGTTLANANEAFIWADDEDFAPFMSKTANQQSQGIFKDIIVEVFSRMDIPLEIKVYPWKRTQAIVKNAEADAMVTIPTEERLKFLDPTAPIVFSEYRIFSNTQHANFDTIMDIKHVNELKNFKIVDYLGNGWAEKNFKGFNVQWAPKYTNAIFMLARERADVFVADSIMMKYRIRNLLKENAKDSNDLKTIAENPNTLESIPFTLLIRKDSKYKKIIPRFNNTLSEMKQDGTYQRIIEKYTNIQDL